MERKTISIMKARVSAHMFEDTVGRIRRALDDLRRATKVVARALADLLG